MTTMHDTFRTGSLFAGVGGFDLAALSLDWRTAFTSEYDRWLNRFLTDRFPEAQHLGDVTGIDWRTCPEVDVLTAGSPCQDFSIAGYRAGLEGARSGLFAHFVQAIDILQHRGLKVAIWENVTGALTSKRGADFGNVLAALVGASEPVVLPRHRKGRTARYAGVVYGPRGTVAWRTLDAQHFGVPQRRQRVFAVLTIGSTDAPSIVFPGYVTARSWGKAADHVTDEVVAFCLDDEGAPYRTGMEGEGHHYTLPVRLSEVLQSPEEVDPKYELSPKACAGILERGSRHGKALHPLLHAALQAQAEGTRLVLTPEQVAEVGGPFAAKMRQGKPGGGKGWLLSEQLSLTLATGNDQYLIEPVALAFNQRCEARMSDVGYTVQAQPGVDENLVLDPVPVTFSKQHRASSPTDAETWREGGVANTLNLYDTGDVRATDIVVEPIVFDPRTVAAPNDRTTVEPGNLVPTLTALQHKQPIAVVEPVQALTYRVRRLTPVECERLMGMPDGWTELDATTKDTQRYRALGNAVAVPVAEWVLERVDDHLCQLADEEAGLFAMLAEHFAEEVGA